MEIIDLEIWHIPQSKVRHLHMVSTKEPQQINRKAITEIMQKDQQYFEMKWHREGIRNGEKWFGMKETILV